MEATKKLFAEKLLNVKAIKLQPAFHMGIWMEVSHLL